MDLSVCVGCAFPSYCRRLMVNGAKAFCERNEATGPIVNEPQVDTSVAVKQDDGKIRTELLPVGPMLAIAEVLTFGAKKYADHNWRKGFKWSRLLGAATRHLFAFMRGEDKDPETGLSHLAHLGCCVLFLLEHEQRGLGEDDRYKG